MKRFHAFAALASLALGSSALASPEQVDFTSTQNLHGLGTFTGTAVYDNTNDTLTLNITNTSGRGGMTAFAFETEKGITAKFHQGSDAFKDDRNKKGIVNAKPFGKYEAGAGVNGKWGSTGFKKGLAAGGSETFIFDVTGANASTLTTTDFFNDTNPEIVAHFAGFKHHKQDKAGAFGHLHIVPTSTDNTNKDIPVFDIIPPVVINPPGNTITPPGNGGTVAAVPLPAAAPAGIAMMVILAAAGGFKRLRAVFA